MKISSVFFTTYYSIKPTLSIVPQSFLMPTDQVESSSEERYDVYHPSLPVDNIEEDLYYRLKRHQYDFIPHINPYVCIVINHIRLVTNSVSTLFRDTLRRIDKMGKRTNQQRREKNEKFSSAFTYISNLYE